MPNTREIYEEAVRNEIMSQNLYRMLANSFRKKREVLNTLKNLQNMEKLHEDKLREAYDLEFPGEELKVSARLNHKFKPTDLETPDQVLEFAISREIIAAGIYRRMAKDAPDPVLEKLLLGLAEEEENHKTVLEDEILRMDGLMTWYDPSELNGLVED